MEPSIFREELLRCPQCGKKFTITIWQIIDTVTRTDLAEQIRNGTLHAFTCPKCRYVVAIDEPLLLYRPGKMPALLFSPAQYTTDEEDQKQAASLIAMLRRRLGRVWQDSWLEIEVSKIIIPRESLSVSLDIEEGSTAATLSSSLDNIKDTTLTLIKNYVKGACRDEDEACRILVAQGPDVILPTLRSGLKEVKEWGELLARVPAMHIHAGNNIDQIRNRTRRIIAEIASSSPQHGKAVAKHLCTALADQDADLRALAAVDCVVEGVPSEIVTGPVVRLFLNDKDPLVKLAAAWYILWFPDIPKDISLKCISFMEEIIREAERALPHIVRNVKLNFGHEDEADQNMRIVTRALYYWIATRR